MGGRGGNRQMRRMMDCQQANVDEETAKNALNDAEGDLARAILMLTTN